MSYLAHDEEMRLRAEGVSEMESKVRRLKGEDDKPKVRKQKDERYDGETCFGSLLNIDLKVCKKCKKRKACEAVLVESEGAQDDEVEDQPVQDQLPTMAVKQDTIKVGKTDLHVTYRDTTFFLLGLLCGVVL